jgi:hypothetical protein
MRMNRSHRRASFCLALPAVMAGVVPHSADAQPATRRPQSNADSARLAADLFFRAVADERWSVAAAMTDTTLMRFIVAERLRWQPQTTRPELTLDDFLRDDPAKPRAVAEYEFRRYRERAVLTDGDGISYEFAGVKSLLELARLSALEASARYLQAQDARENVREAARRVGCPDSVAGLSPNLRRIVGVALASDTVAYVLHEDGAPPDESDGLPRPEPMVMQLRLRGSRWTIMPGSALLRSPSSVGIVMRCDFPRRPPS